MPIDRLDVVTYRVLLGGPKRLCAPLTDGSDLPSGDADDSERAAVIQSRPGFHVLKVLAQGGTNLNLVWKGDEESARNGRVLRTMLEASQDPDEAKVREWLKTGFPHGGRVAMTEAYVAVGREVKKWLSERPAKRGKKRKKAATMLEALRETQKRVRSSSVSGESVCSVEAASPPGLPSMELRKVPKELMSAAVICLRPSPAGWVTRTSFVAVPIGNVKELGAWNRLATSIAARRKRHGCGDVEPESIQVVRNAEQLSRKHSPHPLLVWPCGWPSKMVSALAWKPGEAWLEYGADNAPEGLWKFVRKYCRESSDSEMTAEQAFEHFERAYAMKEEERAALHMDEWLKDGERVAGYLQSKKREVCQTTQVIAAPTFDPSHTRVVATFESRGSPVSSRRRRKTMRSISGTEVTNIETLSGSR